MVLTSSPITTVAKLLQYLKASLPMLVTPSGMVTEVRPEQL